MYAAPYPTVHPSLDFNPRLPSPRLSLILSADTVADLHVYVDSLDVSMMVADPQTKQYAPKGKDYIKSQLLVKMKSAAM